MSGAAKAGRAAPGNKAFISFLVCLCVSFFLQADAAATFRIFPQEFVFRIPLANQSLLTKSLSGHHV